MRTNFFRILPIVLILLIFLASCIDENPNLVNPPPQTETVGLRFYNLAADQKERILDLAGNYNLSQFHMAL